MKILFIKPPSEYHNAFPPIGIVQLATCCKIVGDVKILDCLNKKYTHKDFEEYIRKNEFDVAAISAFSAESDSAVKCAKIIKGKDKGITTILGGTHLHNLYHKDENNSYAIPDDIDYTMVGEAEESLPLLLEEIKKPSNERDFDKIAGLGYRHNGKIKTNQPTLIEDLDSIPICDWSLIDIKSYKRSYHTKRHPYAPVLTSRGCPYLCTFCSIPSVSGRKFRPRSPENVVEEIKSLYNLGVKEIMFWDDNFTLYKDRAMKICDLLIKENMDLIWSCPQGVRVDRVDEEILSKMKKAGCYYVALGIESGSDKILKDMKKNLDIKTIKEKVPLIRKMGINTWGFFILGFPTETKEDVLATLKLSRSLNLSRVSYHLYMPVPGTESYDSYVTDKNIEWGKIKTSKSLIAYNGMTPEELKRMQMKGLLRFYLKPTSMFNLLINNLSFNQMIQLFEIFKEYVIHIGKGKSAINDEVSTA